MQSRHSKGRNISEFGYLTSLIESDSFRYLFKFLWISDLEALNHFANTETIHTCIEGANLWADNRKKLREAASEFTADDWLLVCTNCYPTPSRPYRPQQAMYDPGTRPNMERGFIEAAQDDTIAFHLDLRKEIETHALVNDKATQTRCYFKSQVFFTFQYIAP